MHHGLFTGVVIGALLVHFGLDGVGSRAYVGPAPLPDAPAHGPIWADRSHAAVPQRQSPPTPLYPRQGPATDRTANARVSPDEYSRRAMERLLPPVGDGRPPPGMHAPRPEMAADIQAGVQELDTSMRQLPGYAIKLAAQVEQHGLAALAYEDPEMKRAGQALGQQVGSGIRHLMSALGKDIVATSQESMGNGRHQ
jgi:hypothetical protein